MSHICEQHGSYWCIEHKQMCEMRLIYRVFTDVRGSQMTFLLHKECEPNPKREIVQ